MTPTADTLVPEQLWQAIGPLLPTPPPRSGGRPRAEDRAAQVGIADQLRSGIPWRLLPTRQLGCGSPVTCWRRLRDWQRAGVWQRLHRQLLEQLGREGRLGWSRASLDSLSVRAKRGAARPGANPADRGKPASKYHLLVDRNGMPMAVCLSAANTHCDDPGGSCGERLTRTPTGVVPLSRSVGSSRSRLLQSWRSWHGPDPCPHRPGAWFKTRRPDAAVATSSTDRAV
jgi:transposase